MVDDEDAQVRAGDVRRHCGGCRGCCRDGGVSWEWSATRWCCEQGRRRLNCGGVAELVRADAGVGGVAGAAVEMVRRRRTAVARTERMVVVEVLRWCVKVAGIEAAVFGELQWWPARLVARVAAAIVMVGEEEN